MTLTPQEIADGWIPHDGGPNSVPGKWVSLRQLGYSIDGYILESDIKNWPSPTQISSVSSIFPYRIPDTGGKGMSAEDMDLEHSKVRCEACDRGEIFGLSADDGSWFEFSSVSGGASEYGLYGSLWLTEHGGDGATATHQYVRADRISTPHPEPNTPAEPVGEKRYYEDLGDGVFRDVDPAEPVGDGGIETIAAIIREAHSDHDRGASAPGGDGALLAARRLSARRLAQYPPDFFEPRRTEFSKGLKPFIIGSDVWTDHATATRLLAEKEARIEKRDRQIAGMGDLVAASEARALAAEAEVERLREALSTALGYMRNARIDLETGATKATAIRTISGGISRTEAVLNTIRGE